MTWLHHFTDSCEQIGNYDGQHSRTDVKIPNEVVKCYSDMSSSHQTVSYPRVENQIRQEISSLY
ncbi:hypothetical protein NC651_001777 [Populus alba x Populus x berolinensis]|nr:hypothetical protein NC651_001777 [Populus alba x Populus x berolinensis]